MLSGGENPAMPALITPALILYYLCCWPQEPSSDTSSEKNSRRSVSRQESGSRHSRHGPDLFSRRMGSSAVSLHLPSTSGIKSASVSAHRSHECIARRRSQPPPPSAEARYHSAPSVIDEVLHRRDWDRSARDLRHDHDHDQDHESREMMRIPLRPDHDQDHESRDNLRIPLRPDHDHDHESSEMMRISLRPDHDHGLRDNMRIPLRPDHDYDRDHDHDYDHESNMLHIPLRSNQDRKPQPTPPCKKHYTNIKSSRKKEKEKEAVEDKDRDATETDFYIGDDASISNELPVAPHGKDAKQSFNESLRRRPGLLDDVLSRLEALDHGLDPRRSSRVTYPPPSVEPVGYESYNVDEAGERSEAGGAGAGVTGGTAVGGMGGAGGTRARHCSDGDILAPPLRPESGAFSESDLDLELEGEERPPPYETIHEYVAQDKKETAI